MRNVTNLLLQAKDKLDVLQISFKVLNVSYDKNTIDALKDYVLKLENVYHGKNKSFFDVFKDISNLYNVYKLERLKQRTANPNTKTYDTIRGSTRKIRKQKGTGFARQGRIRSPLHKGGVITFGPNNRNYDFKINKKSYKLALLTAIIHKLYNERIVIINMDSISIPKAKNSFNLLQNLNKVLAIPDSSKIDVIIDKDDNFVKASQNIENINFIDYNKLKVIDLINNNYLMFSNSFEKFLTRCK